jgi:hypothetical protein
MRIPGLDGFPNQSVNTKSRYIIVVLFLRASKQFSQNEEMRANPASGVQKIFGHMYRSGVTAVDTDSVEEAGDLLGILGHVVPEPWVVVRASTEAEFDSIIVDHDFTSKVCR